MILLASFVNALSCVPYGNVTWGLKPEYGVGENITVRPVVSSNTGSLEGKSATITLLQKNVEGQFIPVSVYSDLRVSNNAIGSVTFTGLRSTGSIKIQAQVIDASLPSGSLTFTSSEIFIRKTLQVTASIPQQVSNLNPIKIDMFISDAETPSVQYDGATTIIAKVKSMDTGEEISGLSVASDKITFSTTRTGLFRAYINVSGTGFLPASAVTTFTITSPTETKSLKIDGIPYETLSEGKIDKGNKKLEVSVSLGGTQLVPLDQIDAVMTPPDSSPVIITFTPKDSSKTIWTGSYNFLEGSRTYTFKVKATRFTTPATVYTFPPVDFTTVGQQCTGNNCDVNPPPTCTGSNCPSPTPVVPTWIWYVLGGVIVLIIVFIVIYLRRK